MNSIVTPPRPIHADYAVEVLNPDSREWEVASWHCAQTTAVHVGGRFTGVSAWRVSNHAGDSCYR